jgi:hypothetical protein
MPHPVKLRYTCYTNYVTDVTNVAGKYLGTVDFSGSCITGPVMIVDLSATRSSKVNDFTNKQYQTNI